MIAYRGQLKKAAETLELPNITYNDIVLFAVSRVLPHHSALNAHLLDDKMRFFDHVHLGMSVGSKYGAQHSQDWSALCAHIPGLKVVFPATPYDAKGMTIGWGGLGELWQKPVCTVYVRQSRYTFQFMESHDYFTVSVLPESRKDVLLLCGTKSGRDTDKISTCGLTVCYGAGDAPFFDEAELVLVCRKLYAQDMTATSLYINRKSTRNC